MREVLIGQTDYSVFVKINLTTGAPATGLVFSDIDLAYARLETDNDATTSDVTPATLASLTAAHSDWGFIEVSATDHPGLYRLDLADAVFASGAWESVVTITDASGTDFYAEPIGFRLVGVSSGALDAAAVWSYGTRTLTGGQEIAQPAQQYGKIELVQGNDYSTTARSLLITIATGAEWPTDLSLWTWTFACDINAANNISGAATSITGTVTVSTPTGSSRALLVAITSANMATAVGMYDFAVRGTRTGEKWDAVIGTILVRASAAA